MVDVTETTFERDVIEASNERPIVVDFWAPWCGPCLQLAPALEHLASSANGTWSLAKVNVDHNQGLAQRFRVQGIPHVVGFVAGEPVDHFVGVRLGRQLEGFIDGLVAQAPSAAEREPLPENPADAELFWRARLDGEVHRGRALAGLVESLVAQGKHADAGALQADLRAAGAPSGRAKADYERAAVLAQLASGLETPNASLAAARRLALDDGLLAGLAALIEFVAGHRKDPIVRTEARLDATAILTISERGQAQVEELRSALANALW